MGEAKLKRLQSEQKLLSCAGVQTACGRARVRWEADSAATPMGLLCCDHLKRTIAAIGPPQTQRLMPVHANAVG